MKGGFLKPADDLSALRHVAPQKVEAFLNEVNSIPASELTGRKLVVALGTGGTISSAMDDKNILMPTLDFAGIISQVAPDLAKLFLIKGLDLFRIDSSQMDYSHVRDQVIIITYLARRLERPLLGFLVTHGTDTMHYSGAAVSLMTGPGLQYSIVYTGAQKPITAPLSDGRVNIRNALFTLEALSARRMAEVVLVMGDKAFLATGAEKVDDTLANAFDAPIHQSVARFDRLDYPVQLASWLKERRAAPFEPTIWPNDFSQTLVVKSTLGLSPEIVARQARDEAIKAIVIYTFGASTVYQGLVDAIMVPAREHNMPVFAVNPVYGNIRAVYEPGFYMLQQGIIPLYMTLPTTLAKIEVGLRMYENNNDALKEFMQRSYVGEVPSAESIASERR